MRPAPSTPSSPKTWPPSRPNPSQPPWPPGFTRSGIACSKGAPMSPATQTSAPTETLLDALHWRYATKVFDTARAISVADWQALEDSLVLTPSSYGLQPYRFIVVTDPVLKAQLRPV